MTKTKRKVHDVELHWHFETERAIAVSENGIADAKFFLPKSQIEFEQRDDGSVVVSMPEWLAKEKGLI